MTFAAVSMRDLLVAPGAHGQTIYAMALTDCAIELQTSDAAACSPIVANLENGKPRSVRDKGPHWIIHPFDDKSNIASESSIPAATGSLAA